MGQVLSEKRARELAIELNTGKFRKSGNDIPEGVLKSKGRQYSMWQKSRHAAGRLARRGKWTKSLHACVKKDGDKTRVHASTEAEATRQRVTDQVAAVPEHVAKLLRAGPDKLPDESDTDFIRRCRSEKCALDQAIGRARERVAHDRFVKRLAANTPEGREQLLQQVHAKAVEDKKKHDEHIAAKKAKKAAGEAARPRRRA